MDNDLKATAYHEAGHAVVSYLYDRRFKQVTIEPSDDAAGRVEYYDGLMIGKILEGTHCNIWLMEHPEEADKIVVRSVYSAMAGYIAQEMGVPGSVTPEHWEDDKENIGEILICIDPENGWDDAESTVRAALENNWHLVECLAEALLEKRTISGKEARSILSALSSQTVST